MTYQGQNQALSKYKISLRYYREYAIYYIQDLDVYPFCDNGTSNHK